MQERKRHINLRKSLGTPAGCPWDTRRTNKGLPAGVPGISWCLLYRKTDIFAGTPAGCSRDTRRSRGWSEILCDFSYVPSRLPRSPWVIKFHGRLGVLICRPGNFVTTHLACKKKQFFSLQLRDRPFDSFHSGIVSPFNSATHEKMEDPFATPQIAIAIAIVDLRNRRAS